MYSIYTIHAYLNKLCFVASKNMQMTFDTDKKEKENEKKWNGEGKSIYIRARMVVWGRKALNV